MLSYILRRLLLLIPTLFGITVVTFCIICLAPGDPAEMQTSDILDVEQSQRRRQQMVETYHLDRPLHIRYGLWIWDMARGDLGRSVSTGEPVLDRIKKAFWPTVSVNALSIVLAFLICIPIGLHSAARRGGWFDRSSGLVLYVLYAIPPYVGAIVLVLYLSIRWNWLPMMGMTADNHDELSAFWQFVDLVAHMTIYLVCVTYGSLAFYARFVRQNLLEVVKQDYIRTARAKGLSERVVIYKHAFRNTLIPLLTLVGLIIPTIIGGSVILEKIFNWPGLGKLFFTAMLERDVFVLMALSTASAVLVLLSTLTVDILYGIVDPRVSHG